MRDGELSLDNAQLFGNVTLEIDMRPGLTIPGIGTATAPYRIPGPNGTTLTLYRKICTGKSEVPVWISDGLTPTDLIPGAVADSRPQKYF